MRLAVRTLLVLAPFLCAGVDAAAPLRVRVDAELLACVRVALEPLGLDIRFESGAWDAPGSVDLLVASSAEINRALETGRADPTSDLDLGRVQWLLRTPADSTVGTVRTLDEAASSADGIWLPAGALSYDARRALERRYPGRLRQARDLAELAEAPVAVVPATLAGSGRGAVVDVPPLLVRAAAASGSTTRTAVRRALDYLGGDAGRSAFAACSAP